MSEDSAFPIDFSALTRAQLENITRVCHGSAGSVFQQAGLFTSAGLPIVNNVRLKLAQRDADAFTTFEELINLFEDFYGRLALIEDTQNNLLLSALSAGDEPGRRCNEPERAPLAISGGN